MSNKFIDIRIVFDKIPSNYDIQEEVTGEVQVKVHKKVSFKYLNVNLIFELRGKASPVSMPGQVITLANNGTWNIGETYKYKFRFSGGVVPSYKGYNLQTLWYLDTTYLLKEASQRDTGTYKFYKKIFSSRMSESHRERIDIRNRSKRLRVETNSIEIPDGNYYWIVSFIILFICYLFYQNGKIDGAGYIIPAIAFIISLLSFGLYLRDFYYFRNMNIRFLQESPEHIQAEILLNGRANPLKNVRIGYKIVEKVLDDRGTSTVTLTHENYKYLHQEPLTGRRGVISVNLPLPTHTKFPASFAYGQHEVNWIIFFQTPDIFSFFLKEIPIRVVYE